MANILVVTLKKFRTMIINQASRQFLQPLFTYLEQLHPLSEELMFEYERNCQLLHVRKNKFILSPIDNNNAMYFLLTGLVRGFVRDGKKDISTWFGFKHQFVEAISHPEQGTNHSIEYIQALEDCILVRIPYSFRDFLYSNYPEAHVIARKLLAIHHYTASNRSMLARIPTAAGRYLKFLSTETEINRIPQRYLASYLGMRLETLSRIRNRSAEVAILKLA